MSIATVVSRGFGTFGSNNFVTTYGYGNYGGTAVAATVSGIRKKLFRVRRADFSSQKNYEFALRAALLDANFAVRPSDDQPIVPRGTKSVKFETVPLDKSLAAVMDTEIKVSAEKFAVLQRAAEMEELEMFELFITIIESEWP